MVRSPVEPCRNSPGDAGRRSVKLTACSAHFSVEEWNLLLLQFNGDFSEAAEGNWEDGKRAIVMQREAKVNAGNRVLTEMLIVSQPVKILPELYVIQTFISVVTKDRHLTLSLIQCIPSLLRAVSITSLPGGLFPSCFPTCILTHFSSVVCVLHVCSSRRTCRVQSYQSSCLSASDAVRPIRWVPVSCRLPESMLQLQWRNYSHIRIWAGIDSGSPWVITVALLGTLTVQPLSWLHTHPNCLLIVSLWPN
jgi:hypothetical protein